MPRLFGHRFFSFIGKPLYWAVLFSLSGVEKCFSFFRFERKNYQESYSFFREKTALIGRGSFQRTVLLGFILLVFCSLSVSFGFWIYTTIFRDLPTVNDLQVHSPNLTTKIFDRNGVLLYSIYKDENRSLVPLEDLPPWVIDATVSIEDKDFFSHKGISIQGMARALRAILSGKSVQGGSTITQQLVKNTLLTRERTIVRKIKEIILSLQIERELSKSQILEMYLNEAAYGGSTYGVEEAARVYFGLPASNLSLAQAAFLAGLPQAPSLYNPFGNHKEAGFSRQQEVLRRMFEDKKISPLQYEQAKNEKLVFAEDTTDIKAPHFVMLIREMLAKEYGEELLAHGGLQIHTTLDSELQEKVQEIVSSEVSTLKHLHITNGAALVTNPKTGEVLAMVGSTNYFDAKNDGQVNVTIRPRQPGSSIKPVTYAAALERGFTPASSIDDSPISFSIPGSPVYAPKNYDGRFHGKVSLRTALASSLNIPAVKTEASIGVATLVEKGRELGITTWDDPSRFGLSLTLGAGEVKMVDMAEVYGTFATGGVRVPLRYVLTVEDKNGRVLFSNPCVDTTTPCGGKRHLDARIAYQIANILSDNQARSLAFGLHSVLDIPGHQVAVKTGTTNVLRDNWTDGFTSDRVAIVWVGNNDNTPMSSVTSGVIGASPIWNKIMMLFLSSKTPHAFSKPDGLVALQVCRSTGRPTCGTCGIPMTEYFLPGSQPQIDCSPPPLPVAVGGDTRILDGISTQ